MYSDFNGDGIADLALGIYGEDVQAGETEITNAGAVSVLYGSSSGLQATSPNDQFLTQEFSGIGGDGAEVEDRFGRGLGTGDFNGDGYADLTIGVDMEDIESISADDAGAFHVLYGSVTGLQTSSPDDQFYYQGTLDLDADPDCSVQCAHDGDTFGRAFGAGDFNGDTYDDLAIGVLGEDVAGISNAGAVQVVYGSEDGLDATGTVVPDDEFWAQNYQGLGQTPEETDSLGRVLTAGDFDQDGFADLVMGVYLEDLGTIQNPITDAGFAHVLYGSEDGLQTSDQDLLTQAPLDSAAGGVEASDWFGRELEVGNFGKTSKDDLAIGAY